MVRTLRHRALKRLFQNGDARGIDAGYRDRIEDVLAHLDMATRPADLDLPGFRLHPLKGALKGYWSVRVSSNWRIIFRMKDGDVFDVDLMDYH